jgi:hypothetical protein
MRVALTIRIQKAQRDMDEWEILASDIKGRLGSIQEIVENKQPSESLQTILIDYSKWVHCFSKGDVLKTCTI